MAQITSLMVAVIMAITPVTQAGAWDCTPGLLYCGDTLVRNARARSVSPQYKSEVAWN
ncbi:hypothetical protein E4U35_003100 [Claviceps purpurea]|nr:hypothetical protein E4U35_003100 [Claviceps purpurea]